MQNIRGDLLDGPEVNLVDKEEVLYAFRVVENPSAVFIMVDIKLITSFEPGPHCGLGSDVLVHH